MTHPDKPAEKDWTSLTTAEFLAILKENGIVPEPTEKPADDWTLRDDLAARFMAVRMASGQNWSPPIMVSQAYADAAAFMAERQRRKGAGE